MAAKKPRWASPQGLTGLGGLVVLALAAVFGPILFGVQAEATSVADRLLGASADHPFGTDELGRDILARVFASTRKSLLLALGATGISIVGGLVLGIVPTVVPPRLRRLLTATIEILLAFPWLLLALFFSVIWGASAGGAMLAVGFAGIPSYARLVYTMASSVMGRDFVRAARIVGVSPAGVLGRHVVPNIAGPLIVNIAAHASTALLSFAALSFLGLGVQAPEYDWGRLLREGVSRIYLNPMAAIGPGIAIVLAGIVFTLVSDIASDAQSRRVFAPLPRRAPARSGAAPVAGLPTQPVLAVEDLHVSFPDGEGGLVERVHGVSFEIRPGEVLGIVGESGSGKSVTAMAAAGLLEPPAVVAADQVRFQGIDMTAPFSKADSDRLGLELAMVFQDPLTSLNPSLTIGRQLTEVTEVHQNLSHAESLAKAGAALTSVGIAEAPRRLKQYPHEFSGGMRQRAMIAMGLMGKPALLIADEPTTALDVTVQRQVLRVIRDAQRHTGTAVLFISHDIALISSFCDRVLVMKDGYLVESLDAARLDKDARHRYTRALIACVPDMNSDRSRPLPVIDDLMQDPSSSRPSPAQREVGE
jgi:ABC-type dipeptide/oligopeptide/nickel transport system ATPase component/ABC-type dipeptide/oligopeptide/nickel transport system permease subunit